jgi:hypothetical protein
MMRIGPGAIGPFPKSHLADLNRGPMLYENAEGACDAGACGGIASTNDEHVMSAAGTAPVTEQLAELTAKLGKLDAGRLARVAGYVEALMIQDDVPSVGRSKK